MNELWKTIPEFPNYQVSSYGRIRRRTRGSSTFVGKILRLHTQKKSGYIAIKLWNDRYYRTLRVHVLVAEAFLPTRPTPKHEVNHKDGIKANCFVDNLEWATRKENQQHARSLGLMQNQIKGESCHLHKATEETVKEIRRLAAVGILRHREIACLVGLSRPQVSSIVRGDTWKHLT